MDFLHSNKIFMVTYTLELLIIRNHLVDLQVYQGISKERVLNLVKQIYQVLVMKIIG